MAAQPDSSNPSPAQLLLDERILAAERRWLKAINAATAAQFAVSDAEQECRPAAELDRLYRAAAAAWQEFHAAGEVLLAEPPVSAAGVAVLARRLLEDAVFGESAHGSDYARLILDWCELATGRPQLLPEQFIDDIDAGELEP
jgi:hypothetical protein